MIIFRYGRRILHLWIIWFWFPALDAVGLVLDTFCPSFDPPRWLYWTIPVIGFVCANIKLFADMESEKQGLFDLLEGIDSEQANIRFKKRGDFFYFPSSHEDAPFADLKHMKVNPNHGLDQNGAPPWIVIGAYLEGVKNNHQLGRLGWKVKSEELPYPLEFDPEHIGAFQQPNGVSLTEIKGRRENFDARFVIPIRIQQRENPLILLEGLNSSTSYQIEISYWTKRDLDSKSREYTLILEGSCQEIISELCQTWNNWGFGNLAKRKECSNC